MSRMLSPPVRGLVNPSPGVFDFEGYRSLKTFLDYANAAGLWVVLRPGMFPLAIPFCMRVMETGFDSFLFIS